MTENINLKLRILHQLKSRFDRLDEREPNDKASLQHKFKVQKITEQRKRDYIIQRPENNLQWEKSSQINTDSLNSLINAKIIRTPLECNSTRNTVNCDSPSSLNLQDYNNENASYYKYPLQQKQRKIVIGKEDDIRSIDLKQSLQASLQSKQRILGGTEQSQRAHFISQQQQEESNQANAFKKEREDQKNYSCTNKDSKKLAVPNIPLYKMKHQQQQSTLSQATTTCSTYSTLKDMELLAKNSRNVNPVGKYGQKQYHSKQHSWQGAAPLKSSLNEGDNTISYSRLLISAHKDIIEENRKLQYYTIGNTQQQSPQERTLENINEEEGAPLEDDSFFYELKNQAPVDHFCITENYRTDNHSQIKDSRLLKQKNLDSRRKILALQIQKLRDLKTQIDNSKIANGGMKINRRLLLLQTSSGKEESSMNIMKEINKIQLPTLKNARQS